MNVTEVIAQLVAMERAAWRCDPTTMHSMLLTVEEGILELERLTIDTMRENVLLRQRLDSCEQHSVIARPLTPVRRMPESRANAS
jgi:hypothetical protein